MYNDVPQSLELISVDAGADGDPFVTDISIPPAGRAEFVMTGPPDDAYAIFVNLDPIPGRWENADAAQVLANVILSTDATKRKLKVPVKHHIPAAKALPRPETTIPPGGGGASATRSLYFSEATEGTNGPTDYFLTVAGQGRGVQSFPCSRHQ